MKMKRILALLMSVCMALSSIGAVALAEETYALGDLVWSEDFENQDNASVLKDTKFRLSAKGGELNSAAADNAYHQIKKSSSDNKFLEINTAGGIYVPAGAASAKGVFTVDVDLKMEYSSTKAGEYNVGMVTPIGGALYNRNRAYFTQKANAATNQMSWIKNGNGTAGTPASEFNKFYSPDETTRAADQNAAYAFSDWNTYRFIVRKNSNNVPYADVYVNGQYAALIGNRKGNDNTTVDFAAFFVGITNADSTCKVSIDNIKMYYGAMETDAYFTKGKFVSDSYDFDELIVDKVYSTPNEANNDAVDSEGTALNESRPLLYLSKTLGALSRNKKWATKHVAKAGMGGKAADDLYLSNTGRPGVYIHSASGRGNTSYISTHATNIGTYVPEGASIEISADVIFESHNTMLNFEPTFKGAGGLNGIRISPYYYSAAYWQNPDWNANASEGIMPGLPLNKWVNIKIVITRGTSTTCNKLSIYADNRAICENVELDQWYAYNQFTTDTEGSYSLIENAAPITGSGFKGFTDIRLSGDATKSIDNIKVTRYFGGAFEAPKAPEVFKKVPRGIIYAGDKKVSDIVAEYGLANEAYTIRDNSGTEITDTAVNAAGNFIEVEAEDHEKLYIAMTADKDIFSASDVTEFIAAFSESASDGGGKASATNGLYGKDTDSAMELKAQTCTTMQNDGVTPKNNHFWNSDSVGAAYSGKNTSFEFSVRTDENSVFNAGYRVVTCEDKNEGFGTVTSNKGEEYMWPFSINKGSIYYSKNNTSGVKVCNYRANEWVHVKFYLDYEKDVMTLSINGSEPVVVLDNATSTVKYIDYFRLSLGSATDCAVVDDVKVFTGNEIVRTAPQMSYSNEYDTVSTYFDRTISYSAYEMESGEMKMSDRDVTVSPESAVKVYTDAEGNTVSADAVVTNGAKTVAVNDGIYQYYTHSAREAITVLKAEEGKVNIIVDDNVNENPVTSGIKLIRAAYGADGTLASASIVDVPFEADSFTAVVKTDAYTPASGEAVRYFVWDMTDSQMMPLCDSLDVQ